jgi:hypothetical protein
VRTLPRLSISHGYVLRVFKAQATLVREKPKQVCEVTENRTTATNKAKLLKKEMSEYHYGLYMLCFLLREHFFALLDETTLSTELII